LTLRETFIEFEVGITWMPFIINLAQKRNHGGLRSGEGRSRNKWLLGLDPASRSVEIEAFHVHSAESISCGP